MRSGSCEPVLPLTVGIRDGVVRRRGVYGMAAQGLASALCQNSLQRPQPMSSFELTLSMAIVSITLMVGSLAVSSDGAALRAGGAGTHLTAASLLPIGTNALGGILVGQVTKHMGGVSKGFSIVGGLVVCGVVQVRTLC